MRVPRRITRSILSPRALALSAAGTTLGLCLMIASPVLLTGCGGGGSSFISPGAGINLGRAAVLLGSYQGKETLSNGLTEETTLQFSPGAAFETLVGSYTVRVLSPRSGGGNNYVSFEAGTLAGTILADGSLQVNFTPDDLTRSRATPAQATYTVNSTGTTITNTATGAVITQLLRAIASFVPNTALDGAWTGGPTTVGGLQFTDPKTLDAVAPNDPLISMDLTYSAVGSGYLTTLTLSDPRVGSYQARVSANVYSSYDATIPANFAGISRVDTGQYFVIGRGHLPSNAGPVPFGAVSVSLAGRGFQYEAGVSDDGNRKLQLGTLYLKFDKSDAIWPLLQLEGLIPIKTPEITSIYIPAGNFLVTKGGTTATPTPTPRPSSTPTPTPTPTPSPGVPAVGTIQFSNASSPTNATTTKITDTDVSASFEGSLLHATMTEKNGHATVERDLDMHFFAPNDAALSVGKVFTISNSTPTAAGQAQVTYIETAGQQKFWNALSGTAVVTAHDSQHTTFRITAPMTPFNNAGTTTQPIGTFTIDAVGKF